MGKNSKVLVTGDVSQYDIPKSHAGISGFIQLMEGIRGVGHHKFVKGDIVRAKILQDVVDRYEKWLLENPDK